MTKFDFIMSIVIMTGLTILFFALPWLYYGITGKLLSFGAL